MKAICYVMLLSALIILISCTSDIDWVDNIDVPVQESCLEQGCPECNTCQADGTCQLIPNCIPCDQNPNCDESIICDTTTCSERSQICVNDKCQPKSKLNYGLVYVYDSADTYNPNWQTEFNDIKQKIEASFPTFTDKVTVTIDILGEIQTDTFCWNPGEIGVEWDVTGDDGSTWTQLIPLPGSTFNFPKYTVQDGYQLKSSTCTNCKFETDDVGEHYAIDCSSPLADYENLFSTGKIGKLHQEISNELSINYNDYAGMFVIFGKFGIDTRDTRYLEFTCTTGFPETGGYSVLIMAENAITNVYYEDCSQFNNLGAELGAYLQPGWHRMVHEILHRIGAVDIYSTGFSHGTKSYRDKALEVDPRADESIMGDSIRPLCMEDASTGERGYEYDGTMCSTQELESIYLDLYSKQIIGID
jgi:hypothetical protein